MATQTRGVDGAGGPGPRGGLLRAGVLVSAAVTAAAACALLAWRAGSRAARSLAAPGPARVEDAVVVLASVAVGALLLWCLVGGGAALAAAVLRRLGRPSQVLERASTRLAPSLVRRLAAAAVGIGVLGSAAAPASARTPAPPAAVAAVVAVPAATAVPVPGQDTVVPSWPPEGQPWSAPPAVAPPPAAPAPTAPARTTPAPGPRAAALPSAEGSRRLPDGDDGDVVVQRGDTLWSIAARCLPAGTTASQVAVEWPRWWAANRDVVGDDPDLLLPGQLLRAPGAGR